MSEKKMQGILGGTFDPPHLAHLKIADYLLASLAFEKISLLPCYLPALKQTPHTSAIHRLAMVRAAIANHPKIEVDTREIEKAQPSYTIDSVAAIREEIGATQALCFIMGSDAFDHFLEWKNWQSILMHCHLIVMDRAKPEHKQSGLIQTPLKTFLKKYQVNQSNALMNKAAGHIFLSPFEAMNVSSTQIRKELYENPQGIQEQLPQAVSNYIKANALYQ